MLLKRLRASAWQMGKSMFGKQGIVVMDTAKASSRKNYGADMP